MLTFEWDDEKDRANQAKHGVSFDNAKAVFSDRSVWEVIDARFDYGEERILSVGMAGAQLLAVANTQHGETCRIISARRATKRESDGSFKNRG